MGCVVSSEKPLEPGAATGAADAPAKATKGDEKVMSSVLPGGAEEQQGQAHHPPPMTVGAPTDDASSRLSPHATTQDAGHHERRPSKSAGTPVVESQHGSPHHKLPLVHANTQNERHGATMHPAHPPPVDPVEVDTTSPSSRHHPQHHHHHHLHHQESEVEKSQVTQVDSSSSNALDESPTTPHGLAAHPLSLDENDHVPRSFRTSAHHHHHHEHHHEHEHQLHHHTHSASLSGFSTPLLGAHLSGQSGPEARIAVEQIYEHYAGNLYAKVLGAKGLRVLAEDIFDEFCLRYKHKLREVEAARHKDTPGVTTIVIVRSEDDVYSSDQCERDLWADLPHLLPCHPHGHDTPLYEDYVRYIMKVCYVVMTRTSSPVPTVGTINKVSTPSFSSSSPPVTGQQATPPSHTHTLMSTTHGGGSGASMVESSVSVRPSTNIGLGHTTAHHTITKAQFVGGWRQCADLVFTRIERVKVPGQNDHPCKLM